MPASMPSSAPGLRLRSMPCHATCHASLPSPSPPMRTNPKSDRWIGVVWNESILLSAVIDLGYTDNETHWAGWDRYVTSLASHIAVQCVGSSIPILAAPARPSLKVSFRRDRASSRPKFPTAN
jgi:hypothetical protein